MEHKIIQTLKRLKQEARSEGKALVIKSSKMGRLSYPTTTIDLNEIPDAIISEHGWDRETNSACDWITSVSEGCPDFLRSCLFQRGSKMSDTLKQCNVIDYNDIIKMSEYSNEYYKIGHIDVDAGLCWVGDPCYILHNQEGNPKSIGNDWGDFCGNINDYSNVLSFSHDLGHEGLGICVSTGYGDGSYPVLAKFTKDGRVREIRIIFIEDEDEASS